MIACKEGGGRREDRKGGEKRGDGKKEEEMEGKGEGEKRQQGRRRGRGRERGWLECEGGGGEGVGGLLRLHALLTGADQGSEGESAAMPPVLCGPALARLRASLVDMENSTCLKVPCAVHFNDPCLVGRDDDASTDVQENAPAFTQASGDQLCAFDVMTRTKANDEFVCLQKLLHTVRRRVILIVY